MMADKTAEAAPASAAEKKGFRRKMVGVVRSNKMDKTVVVEVSRRTVDKKYKKYVKSRQRYKAHDEANEYWVGDRVEIRENRPISKEKRWVVTRMLMPSPDRAYAAKDAASTDAGK
jgi:small subunit ribosomal protein S17